MQWEQNKLAEGGGALQEAKCVMDVIDACHEL